MSAALKIGSSTKAVRRKRAINTTPVTAISLSTPSANITEIGSQIEHADSVSRLIFPPGGQGDMPSAASIEPVKSPVRQRRARFTPKAKPIASDVAPIGSSSDAVTGRASHDGDASNGQLPAARSAPNSLASDGEAGRAGQIMVASNGQMISARSATVTSLMSLQRRRRHAIKAQMKLNAMMDSLIAGDMGYRIDLPNAEQRALFAKASAMRSAVEKAKPEALEAPGFMATVPRAALANIPLILANTSSRVPWDRVREQAESEMERLVQTLPVWAWAKGVRGLGPKGLAVVIAEAGQPMVSETVRGTDGLGDYRTVRGLWKHLGYAVVDGRSQRRKKDKAAAMRQGYSPQRHSQVWAFCDDVMFRSQWMGAEASYRQAINANPEAKASCEANGIDLVKLKDLDDLRAIAEPFGIEAAAHPLGPYGEVYAQRRIITDARAIATSNLPNDDPEKWSPVRCYTDARRLMTKALIRDLWLVWNGKPARYAVED